MSTRKRVGKYDNGAVVMINPGTGPVQGRTDVEQALFNMHQFCADSNSALVGHQSLTGEDGRWTFEVVGADGSSHEVEMPGIPLDEVRYMGEPDQNIWDFPRLYVDGSSWVWKYAISCTVNDSDDES